jgi:oxygen-independent coproporphyrinogen-3 oxidase
MSSVEDKLVSRYSASLPRYTSYPTANHFHGAIGPTDYKSWLTEIGSDAALSLYVHIPFCETLCWYCACSTKATRRYEPVAEYLEAVETELLSVSQLIPGRHRLTHLHWGGGSPDILSARDISRLGVLLNNCFEIPPGVEFAVEVDPRLMTPEKADSLVEVGVNRISIGVQDFDPVVQKAIGREQSYEITSRAIDLFRDRGIRSVNVDLVYGLPHQTERSLDRTIRQVFELSPDRIAVFGYAHLPHRVSNQKLIDASALPGPGQRYSMARRLAESIEQAGYKPLGLDHFARPDDSLATHHLRRNFQGYTTDFADVTIGLGASAIGRLLGGYVQNAVAVSDYARRVQQTGLATVRGWELTPEDRLRASVIERLMCDFSFSSKGLTDQFGGAASDLLREADAIIAEDIDGFVQRTDDGFCLTPRGRPFVRNICARFDAHLDRLEASSKHSLSV